MAERTEWRFQCDKWKKINFDFPKIEPAAQKITSHKHVLDPCLGPENAEEVGRSADNRRQFFPFTGRIREMESEVQATW